MTFEFDVTPRGKTTSFTYGADGKIATETDPENNTTSYVYDDYGDLTQVTLPNNLTETYQYNTVNQLTTYTDASGNITQQGHDAGAWGAGFWLAAAGATGGLFGALGSGLAGAGVIADGEAAYWWLTGAGALGYEVRGFGFGDDLGRAVGSMEGVSTDVYRTTCA